MRSIIISGILFLIATISFSGCALSPTERNSEFQKVFGFEYPRTEIEMQVARPKVIAKLRELHDEVKRWTRAAEQVRIKSLRVDTTVPNDNRVRFDRLVVQDESIGDEFREASDNYEFAKTLVTEFRLSKEIVDIDFS